MQVSDSRLADILSRGIRALWILGVSVSAGADEGVDPNAIELAGHRALQAKIVQESAGLIEFSTDGCSGGLSASWMIVAETFPDFAEVHGDTPPWETCCVTHDRAYHAGGRETSPGAGFEDRRTADQALRACVVDTGRDRVVEIAAHYETTEQEVLRAYRTIGEAMYVAVRFGGAPCSGLPWRWGYGSPQCVVSPDDFVD